jgi:hypothetical protein
VALLPRSVFLATSTSSKSARGPSALAESKITVITGAWATVADGSTTGARWSRPAMIGVRRPDLWVARARREINVAGFAFRSSASWLLLQSQLTAGHHRSRRDGLTAEEAPHKKEFHRHAVGHSRRSRLDHEPSLSWCFAVGVAGFEPTASSSRTRVERNDQCQQVRSRARGSQRQVLWWQPVTAGC